MDYKMRSLKHQGLYILPYEYKGYSIKLNEKRIKLQKTSERMAIAYVSKENTEYLLDTVFVKNFLKDFLDQLKFENPSLGNLLKKHYILLQDISKRDKKWLCEGHPEKYLEINMKEIYDAIRTQRSFKETLSKEDRKKGITERKIKREELKKKYGTCIMDGKEIEIGNFTVEPPSIFMGRGLHPLRGKWKPKIKKEDITLNLSPDASIPTGNWKEIVWKPDKMWIAKWEDKLSNKIKYVWFSDSAFFKQEREKEKFEIAEELADRLPEIEDFIMVNLGSKIGHMRQLATVCWLIINLNMRVGDEKDKDEADTVGAITLRPEHIRIEQSTIHFDFLGKDSVRWIKHIEAPDIVIKNIEEFSNSCKEHLFEGINSKKVTAFLNNIMPGLTAKVFRIWRCSTVVENYLKETKIKKDDPEYKKKYIAKFANLEGAKICNHKRKKPVKYLERMFKKRIQLDTLKARLKKIIAEGKRTDAVLRRIEKKELDIEFTEESMEYTLGTSLKSYIDPMIYVRWSKKVDFPLDKIYSTVLRKKYSWCIK